MIKTVAPSPENCVPVIKGAYITFTTGVPFPGEGANICCQFGRI